MIIFQIMVLLFFSCKKTEPFPEEFNMINGSWEAYLFWQCTDTYPGTSCIQYAMDSLDNDFNVEIDKRKIQVFNSNVLSQSYYISKVSIATQNDSLINFRFELHKLNSISEVSQYIVYHVFEDEIVLSSFLDDSFPGVGYSYILKREWE